MSHASVSGDRVVLREGGDPRSATLRSFRPGLQGDRHGCWHKDMYGVSSNGFVE